MTGQLALRAELLRGAHEAEAEDRLPQPVRQHARGQGVLPAHQPPSQRHPVRRLPRGQRAEHRGHPRRHLVAQRLEIAPQVHARDAPLRRGQLAQDRGGLQRHLVQLTLQGRQPSTLLGQRRRHLANIVLQQQVALLGGAFRLLPPQGRQHRPRRAGVFPRPGLRRGQHPQAPGCGAGLGALLLHRQDQLLARGEPQRARGHQGQPRPPRGAGAPRRPRRRLAGLGRLARGLIRDQRARLQGVLARIRRGQRQRQLPRIG